jgi:putative nucleotidyltransferase with HDIG domain
MEVLQSMSGADTDIDALAKRIAQDQAIAARVLRVANSPFYGLQSRVGSIHDAIVVLGLSSVLSRAGCSRHHGPAGGRCPEFSQSRFWRHVLGVAAAARALARPLRRPPEPLFVAGLLHDIGRLAMMTIYPEELCGVLADAQTRDCTLVEAEFRHFGFDHSTVGAELARRWNFPAEIIDALAWHHDPARGVPVDWPVSSTTRTQLPTPWIWMAPKRARCRAWTPKPWMRWTLAGKHSTGC